MNRLYFAPQAREDLREIHDYIAVNSPDTALRFIERIEAKCERLAESPGMGRKRDELAAGLRSFPVGNYLIFYRALADGVEIVHVVSGFRNLGGVFRS